MDSARASEGAVGALGVDMLDVDAEHAFKVAARISSQARHCARTMRTNRSATAFAVGAPERRAQNPDLLAAEDLIERAGVLAVAVTDQEADLSLGEEEAEVASLLADPPSIGVAAATGAVGPASAMLGEEQHAVAPQQRGFGGEEVACDDARRLLVQELAPARPRPSRCATQVSPRSQPPDVRR
jgi:hypothetical protein